MRLLPISCAALALAACQQGTKQQNAANETAASDAANLPVSGVQRANKGHLGPPTTFVDANEKPTKLADFKGRPLLVNLWSITCIPCREELPTLDSLSRTGRVRVVAVNQDSGPHASIVAFLHDHHVNSLGSYQDPKSTLSAALGPDTVWPTSILYGADGKEIWRYIGPLDWKGPEAAKLLAEAEAPSKKV
jgi:thiol-disulfide isomerase/thioredoxin